MENRRFNFFNVGFMTSLLFIMNSFTLFSKDVYRSSIYLIIFFSWFVFVYRKEILRFYQDVTKKDLGKIWVLFIMIVLFSEVVNGNIQDSLFYIFVLPSLYIHTKTLSRKEFFYSVILSILPYLLITLYLISQEHYFGSNSISLIIALIPIAFSQIIFERISRKEKQLKTINIVLYYVLVFAVYLLVFPISNYINSRTSLMVLTVSFILISFVFFFILLNRVENEAVKKSLYFFMAFLIVMVGIKIFPLVFQVKWRQDDISTGRFDIWLETLKNFKLFGNGYYWYENHDLIGPHNLFIGILGFSGFFALVAFIYMLILIFKKFINSLKSQDLLSVFVITTIFSLLVKGLTEGMILMSFFSIYNIILIYDLYNLIGVFEEDKSFLADKGSPSFYKRKSILLIILLSLLFLLLTYFYNYDLVRNYLHKYLL